MGLRYSENELELACRIVSLAEAVTDLAKWVEETMPSDPLAKAIVAASRIRAGVHIKAADELLAVEAALNQTDPYGSPLFGRGGRKKAAS